MAKTRSSSATSRKATGGKKREDKSPEVVAKAKTRATKRKKKAAAAPPRERARPAAVTVEAIKAAVREVLAESRVTRPAAARNFRGGRGEQPRGPARLPARVAPRVRRPVRVPPAGPLTVGMPAVREAAVAAAAVSVFPGVRPGLDTAMCRLVSGFFVPDAVGTWQGSGVLIGRRTVLTVGHNLFNKFDGANPAKTTGVRVLAGPHQHTGFAVDVGPESCWHPREWRDFASDDDYQPDHRHWSRHDYGLINLPEDTDFGDFTPIGWNVVGDAFTPEWFRRTTAVLFGYPKDRIDGVFPSQGRAEPVEDDALEYNMVGEAGQSGGPLMFFYPNGRVLDAFLLGVQSMTFNADTPDAFSRGVRITQEVVDNILANADEFSSARRRGRRPAVATDSSHGRGAPLRPR